ncbi:MAG TPA: UvrD-helicase domain-containing protein [Polyangiaceae bacterium]|nr:UvrD-helicase domain-containing protein [Polyangiaceae bacterium]
MTIDDVLYAFRTNLVVTASAGTGKTFRLVSLYALLTLGLTSKGESTDDRAAAPVLPSRIAATTFSRAAAAEIRERVERVLGAVARARDDAATRPYLTVLAARAEQTRSPPLASRILRERAEAALGELPHALIDTLHGLAGRLLRGSALELGLSPGFGVLEDEGARTSTDAAVDDVLSRAIEQSHRGAVPLLDAGGGLSMMRRRIGELLDRVDEEGVAPHELGCTEFEPVARTWMERLGVLASALATERSRAFGEPALAGAVAAHAWLAGDARAAGRRAVEEHLASVLEPLFTRRSPARPSPAEEAFIAFRESVRGETNAERARRLAAFVAGAPDLTRNAVGARDLLAEIAASRWRARRRAARLGFGDLLRAARDAARDIPAVGARVRSAYDVLLVDEFQDTSRVQRDLVYLLREREDRAGERPAGQLPAASDLAPTGLLVVGDRKQSIYGFRGADVTVFTQVCADLGGRPAVEALELGNDFPSSAAPVASLVTLSHNRRSHASVLDFVNWFATRDFEVRSPYPFDIRYAESEHLRPARSDVHGITAGGVVIIDDRNDLPGDAPPLVRSATGPMREALVAAGVVDRAVHEGAWGDLRPRDIAVLARRRATLPLLEFALERAGVPYFVAGRGLFETREVRDVFALLRLLLDPLDRHALATVLRGPALGLTDASLALLSEPGRGLAPFGSWFRGEAGTASALPDEERQRLARFDARFTALRKIALRLGPSDAIRHAVETFDLDRVGAALPRPVPRLGNLERLIALAAQRGGGIPSFVRWLEQQIADESDEREAAESLPSDDAVTLMTMHASKGLEFRAVVLVDLGAAVRPLPLTLGLTSARGAEAPRLVLRHVRPEGGPLFTPEAAEFRLEAIARDTAERRRLTYVAMTRAKERLFLLVPPQAPQGSAAATLRTHTADGACPCAAIENAASYLGREPMRHPPSVAIPAAPYVSPPVGDGGPLHISTTPLATFAGCPRRYRLVHELGLDPSPTGLAANRSDASSAGLAANRSDEREERRALGIAAHRVLETWPIARWGEPTDSRQVAVHLAAELSCHRAEPVRALEMARSIAAFLSGSYAARVRDAGAARYREEPFVVTIARPEGTLHLRGTIDLLVAFPDGSAEIVDYKSAWQDDAADPTFQLRAYALAAQHLCALAPIRVGVLDLGSTDPTPSFSSLEHETLAAFADHLASLRGPFLAARSSDRFPGVPRARCEQLGCGFLAACHDRGWG